MLDLKCMCLTMLYINPVRFYKIQNNSKMLTTLENEASKTWNVLTDQQRSFPGIPWHACYWTSFRSNRKHQRFCATQRLKEHHLRFQHAGSPKCCPNDLRQKGTTLASTRQYKVNAMIWRTSTYFSLALWYLNIRITLISILTLYSMILLLHSLHLILNAFTYLVDHFSGHKSITSGAECARCYGSWDPTIAVGVFWPICRHHRAQ